MTKNTEIELLQQLVSEMITDINEKNIELEEGSGCASAVGGFSGGMSKSAGGPLSDTLKKNQKRKKKTSAKK